jgi:hypothetical protein
LTQIVWFALIEPTARIGVTVILMILEVAGFPVVQVALDVRMQETWSPVTGA